ncbi:hypothetical protein EYF80_007130 [Liparis tanakae]|uniref:Uncharacterized protein n=1 Tax=Liparis tanakae TaxID=230148 RepID=A0A4Z2IZA4_9TELE|nr:hypothetical protein EYF80_007130 [Liparis tanakae]
MFLRSGFRAPSSVCSGRAGEEPAGGTTRPGGASIRGPAVERKCPLEEMTGSSLQPVMRLCYKLIIESLSMPSLFRGRFLRELAVTSKSCHHYEVEETSGDVRKSLRQDKNYSGA